MMKFCFILLKFQENDFFVFNIFIFFLYKNKTKEIFSAILF